MPLENTETPVTDTTVTDTPVTVTPVTETKNELDPGILIGVDTETPQTVFDDLPQVPIDVNPQVPYGALGA